MKGAFTLLLKAKQASGAWLRCFPCSTVLQQHRQPPGVMHLSAVVLFLPPRPRPAARFEKKDVLGLVTRPAGGSSGRLHRGQSDWKKHI